MNRFSGKVVVVTGAASGFGEAIARRFAAEGTSVCLSDIDVERLAAELGSGERPVDCAPADLSQEDDVPKLIEQTAPRSVPSTCWSTMPAILMARC